MLATTHYANTNPDGTVTIHSTTIGTNSQGQDVILPVCSVTHDFDYFNTVFGKCGVNEYGIVTVVLDNKLVL